jgi:DNA repair photolyase
MLKVVIKAEQLSDHEVKVVLDTKSDTGVKKICTFIEPFNGNLTRNVCEWLAWQVFERELSKIEKDFEQEGVKIQSYFVILEPVRSGK